MTPTYDVSGHELLSDAAGRLSPDELDQHSALAEDLLDLDGTTFSGSSAEKARRAIALQVSHQVRIPGEFAFAESETDAVGQRVRYRGRAEAVLSPAAERIAANLTGEAPRAGVQGSGHTRTEFRTQHPAPAQS